MSDKPVGGRGHKAPYRTKTIRIPVAIEPQVERLTDIYRQAVNQGSWDDVEGKELLGFTTPYRLTKEEAIEEAHKSITRGRMAAKISLEKLLQVLYGDKNIKL